MLWPRQSRTLDQLGTTTPSSRYLLAAACAVFLIPLAFLVDLPVAQFCLSDKVPGDLQRLLSWSEVMAHGIGVAIICIAIWTLDPTRQRSLPRLLVTTYGAGLLADVCKLIAARTRPHAFDFSGGVFETFQGWLPLLFPIEGHRALESKLLSFPSGHTAVGVAFAVSLTRIYPRGRFLFIALACLAVAQRIESGSHYVSDTLAGAVLAFFVCAITSPGNPASRWMDRLERVPQS